MSSWPYKKQCRDCSMPIEMRRSEVGDWGAYNPDGSGHRCGETEKPRGQRAEEEAHLSPAMEGKIRRIAREVAEQVLKEKLGGIVD